MPENNKLSLEYPLHAGQLTVIVRLYWEGGFKASSKTESESLTHLRAVGMAHLEGQEQGLTERGRAYVEHLLRTPFPVQITKWVQPITPEEVN